MELVKLNDKEFKEKVLGKESVSLVDFSATWCLPCKMLGPILEEINDDKSKKFDLYKVDIDDNMDLAKEFDVMSVPTMIIFKDGKEVDRLVGLRQKEQILETLQNI